LVNGERQNKARQILADENARVRVKVCLQDFPTYSITSEILFYSDCCFCNNMDEEQSNSRKICGEVKLSIAKNLLEWSPEIPNCIFQRVPAISDFIFHP